MVKFSAWVSDSIKTQHRYFCPYSSLGGHLHDGGVNVDIFLNEKSICDSRASYSKDGGMAHGEKPQAHPPSTTPAAASTPMGADRGHRRFDASPQILQRDGPHSDDGLAHISSMTVCSMIGRIKKGDQVQIKANYDFNRFQGMKSPEGKYTGVMGIAVMYTAADNPAAAAGSV
jgi:hypothetical protein